MYSFLDICLNGTNFLEGETENKPVNIISEDGNCNEKIKG